MKKVTCDKANYPGDLCREAGTVKHTTEDGREYHFCEKHADPATRTPDPSIFTARNDPRGRV